MTDRGQGFARALHARLASQLIEQVRRSDAPWQREVHPGSVLPYNPQTRKRYHGVNLIALMAQTRADPRWMTYDQAARLGGHVRSGERGMRVHCWQYAEQRPGGAARALSHPRLTTAVVFNGEQVDGLEPAEAHRPALERVELEQLLKNAGAVLVETDSPARYDPAADKLLLPPRATLVGDGIQAGRSLRALAQWTGHPDRLGRDVRAPVGSIAAAAEELRLAIYVMVGAHECGLALPRAPRFALREAWIGLLERDPLEIGRAAADAEQIRERLLHPERHEQHRAAQVTHLIAQANEPSMDNKEDRKTRQYLAVPYADRHAADKLGAIWDKVARCMYIGPRADRDALARWLPTGRDLPRAGDAHEEFAAVLRTLGMEVTAGHPIMDGRRHRLRVEGDRGAARTGYYVGHLDGIPNGFAGNYRTGQTMPWSARGHARTPEQLAELRARAAQAAAERAEERRKLELTVAAKVQTRIAESPHLVQLPIQVAHDATTADRLAKLEPLMTANGELPYLTRKQISRTQGAFVIQDTEGRDPGWWPFAAWPCRDGTLCLPARDASGTVWTMQYIDPDGGKRFEPNGAKRGCFHVIDDGTVFSAAALVIAEGYATATTIHELLRDPRVVVLAGFDSGNLPDVARGLRDRYSRMPIVIAGDNDERLVHRPPFKNVGAEKAREAADAVRGVAITPVFPAGSDPALTDFNDLASLGEMHRATVARQLRGALERAQQQVRAHVDVRQRAMTRGARG